MGNYDCMLPWETFKITLSKQLREYIEMGYFDGHSGTIYPPIPVQQGQHFCFCKFNLLSFSAWFNGFDHGAKKQLHDKALL